MGCAWSGLRRLRLSVLDNPNLISVILKQQHQRDPRDVISWNDILT